MMNRVVVAVQTWELTFRVEVAVEVGVTVDQQRFAER